MVAGVEYWTHGQGEEVAIMVRVVDVVLAIGCFVLGGLFACASVFLVVFSLFDPDGNGTVSFGVWMELLFLVPMSILFFVIAVWLLRSDD